MKHKLYTAWISVEDELPYESGKYLATLKSPSGSVQTIVIVYFDFNLGIWREWCETPKNWNVSHWMALPSPSGNNEQA